MSTTPILAKVLPLRRVLLLPQLLDSLTSYLIYLIF